MNQILTAAGPVRVIRLTPDHDDILDRSISTEGEETVASGITVDPLDTSQRFRVNSGVRGVCGRARPDESAPRRNRNGGRDEIFLGEKVNLEMGVYRCLDGLRVVVGAISDRAKILHGHRV